jgi:hypothetical protein
LFPELADKLSDTMTLSLYLGRGQLSRGRTTIQKGLNMIVSTLPYGNVSGTTGAQYLASVSIIPRLIGPAHH